jgi:hypothetical protein
MLAYRRTCRLRFELSQAFQRTMAPLFVPVLVLGRLVWVISHFKPAKIPEKERNLQPITNISFENDSGHIIDCNTLLRDQSVRNDSIVRNTRALHLETRALTPKAYSLEEDSKGKHSWQLNNEYLHEPNFYFEERL